MSDGRRVFLTGATGFIGSRLARRLSEEGDRLRCLVRPTSNTADLERIDADLVTADLADADALARALDGVDLAYHIAAHYDIGPVDEAVMRRTNVEGTRAFLAAVERAGVTRAVHVSTTAALAPVEQGVGDETTPFPPGYRHPTAYQRTKWAAHELARDAIERGVPVIIALPAYVYGPGDPGPGGRFVEDLLRGRLPGLLRRLTTFSYVHVDDVVDGLFLAGRDGRVGAEYIFSGEARAVDEFAEEVAELSGRKAPRIRFPNTFARITGVVLDAISRLTGIRFPMSRENVDISSGWRWVHSHGRASRDLGWEPRPLAVGLPPTVAWFEEHLARRDV